VSDTSPQAPVKPGATAKKLKFKPAKACGSKTKVLRIKQELDVKPDLHELEEELANEAAWEDPDRQDGVYFLRSVVYRIAH